MLLKEFVQILSAIDSNAWCVYHNDDPHCKIPVENGTILIRAVDESVGSIVSLLKKQRSDLLVCLEVNGIQKPIKIVSLFVDPNLESVKVLLGA